MTKIGQILANNRMIRTENTLSRRTGTLAAIVLCSWQAVGGATNSLNVLLSVDGSHEIGDRIPVGVTLLVDDLKCHGDFERQRGLAPFDLGQ